MKARQILLLFLAAPFATALSYTLSTYAPDNPELDGQPINAGGQRFIIGLNAPTTANRCPMPASLCPQGNTTTVDDQMKLLKVCHRPLSSVYLSGYATIIAFTVAATALVVVAGVLSIFEVFD